MKKVISFFVLALLLSLIGVPRVSAKKNQKMKRLQNQFQHRIPQNRAGRSNIAHMYFFEKNPEDWSIVEGGAWGKMQYRISGQTFDFVFNGHSLEPGSDYMLIYYPDPWPGNGLICLGEKKASEKGNVHIKGSVDTGDLPIESDASPGAKIWLVLSDDVDCDDATMVGWNPLEYLFEYDVITFDDTDE